MLHTLPYKEKHYQKLTQRNIGYYNDLAVNEWFRPWVKQQLVAKFWGGTLHRVPLGTKF